MQTIVAAGLALALFVPTTARADGFMVARFGGEHGNPMTEDPTALYYNPAGIAFAHGTHIYVEGLFALRTRTYDRPASAIDNPNSDPGGTGTPTDGIPFNSGKGTLSNALVSPFFGITSDLGIPNLGVGFSLSVPFGGSQQWDTQKDKAGNPNYPGAVDGSQRWSDIEGIIQAIYFTAGGAYKLPGNLSIGLGVNVISTKTFDLRAATPGGTDDLVSGGAVLEGRGLLDTTGITLSIGAGLAWEPAPQWRIGISYQSQPGFGTVTESGTLDKKFGAMENTPNDVEVKYGLPDIWRFGVAWKATPQVELRLWGDYERWSTFQQQCIINKNVDTRSCDHFDARGAVPAPSIDPANPVPNYAVVNNIPRHWQDAVAFRASGSYYWNPNLELMLGVGFDGNAVPDAALENSLPDENKINATVGASFKNLFADRFQLNVAFSAFFGFDRDIAVRASSPYDFPSQVPDSAGHYHTFIGVLTVGAGYAF